MNNYFCPHCEQTPHQRRIEQFMRMAGQALPTLPCIPPVEVRRLRAELILEEALETIKGLGFDVFVENSGQDEGRFELDDMYSPDLVEIVDGCADISVVTIGTLIACGVRDNAILEEVDNNNLSKFGPGSSLSPSGKLIKPPDHKAPEIMRILEAQANSPRR